MNSRTSLQLKFLVLVQGLFALSLASPKVASAAINIKPTKYSIPAGAYFVSPDGRDSNSCKSFNSPCSVEKAIAVAPSGGTIVFKNGIYRNVGTSINKRLTLQAYPGAQAWLKGSVVVGGWVREGNKWRKDGWTASFPALMQKIAVDSKYPMAANGDMVYVNGVALKQVGSKAGVGAGKFYVDYGRNQLYIGNNPAAKTVEATTQKRAFAVSQKGSSTTIKGLGLTHYADQAILVAANNVTLEDNTSVWNGVSGIWLTQATNATLRGNNASYNGMIGIQAHYSDSLLVENNLISHNNMEQFRPNWAAAGGKFMLSSGVTLRKNTVENNLGTGIWFDISCHKSTVSGNISRNNKSIGLQFELCHLGTATGNLVSGNGAGVFVGDSSSIQVRGNTIVNNKYRDPIIERDSSRVNPNKRECALGMCWITRNNVLGPNSFR